jgi:hypothetical protein
MKFKSPIISQGSGKIGGAVYSHNRGGNYIRNWRTPVNTNTAQQQAIRNDLGTLQARFAQTLTSGQRAAWATFAANVPVVNSMGDSITITAQNWYIKANVPRLQASITPVDAGPTVFELATLTTPTPTITAAGTTASLAFTNTDAWANEVGGFLLVYASRAQNATINFYKGPYRFAGKVTGAATPPTTPATITLPFVSGPTGSKQFFRVVAVRADGRPSPELFLTGTV